MQRIVKRVAAAAIAIAVLGVSFMAGLLFVVVLDMIKG